MSEITCTINPDTWNNFNSLIKEMQETTGAEMRIVIRNAARDLVFAAIKNTPLAAKFEVMKAKSGGYWVVMNHRYTGDTVVFRGTQDQAQKYSKFNLKRIIPNRGFAKSGWIACLPKLGIVPKKNYPGKKNLASQFSEVSASDAQDTFNIRISNLIPYIEDFNNGRNKGGTPLQILERSMQEVNSKWEQRLQRMARNVIKKAVGI
jgi:hypothetical protein